MAASHPHPSGSQPDAPVADDNCPTTNPRGEKIQIGTLACAQASNLGHDLAEQQEPDGRLQGAGEELGRIVSQFTDFCVCHGEDLSQVSGDRAENARFTNASGRCCEIL